MVICGKFSHQNEKNMKEILESDFTFFKAGQGAFYGGRIYDPKNRNCWTIVYDCGSSSSVKGNKESLKNEIDYFHAYPHHHYQFSKKNIIDILFISHLDYDHVSGVFKLLSDFEIKKIVLPYFTREIRQFFLISICAEIDPAAYLSVNDYTSFIENPYQFIKEKNSLVEIYIINGDQPPRNEIYYDGFDNTDSNDIYPKGERIDSGSITELANKDYFLYANNLQFFIQKKWEFTTLVKSAKNAVIVSLINCLKQKLGRTPTSEISFDDIKKLVSNKREEAHDCYRKHLNDINSHGLVLLHGPINFKFLEGNTLCSDELKMKFPFNKPLTINHFRWSNNINFIGTLLMGDTSLAQNNKIDFPKQLKVKFPYVHVFQIPHHGSFKNWDFGVFNDFQIGAELRWRLKLHTVCNFGYGNTYGHPSPEVLDNLSECIILNSQFLRFTTRYYVHY